MYKFINLEKITEESHFLAPIKSKTNETHLLIDPRGAEERLERMISDAVHNLLIS